MAGSNWQAFKSVSASSWPLLSIKLPWYSAELCPLYFMACNLSIITPVLCFTNVTLGSL